MALKPSINGGNAFGAPPLSIRPLYQATPTVAMTANDSRANSKARARPAKGGPWLAFATGAYTMDRMDQAAGKRFVYLLAQAAHGHVDDVARLGQAIAQIIPGLGFILDYHPHHAAASPALPCLPSPAHALPTPASDNALTSQPSRRFSC
ncbi:hypothetical protein [Rugamonas fusca]|uniref:hypothetical protein n=1 Tax=Rugamonas fusca TaxID=2758568 RepID=UPI004055ADE0